MTKAELIQEAVKRKMGFLSPEGAFITQTGKFTGRAADKRFMVQHEELANTVDWGKTNQPISPEKAHEVFSAIEKKHSESEIFEMNGFVSTFPVHARSTSPWHIAFTMNMFRDRPIEALTDKIPEGRRIEIRHCPYTTASELGIEDVDDTIIVVDAKELKIGIIGTQYAGEMKKSAFSLCNYILPELDFLPMHASANCLKDGSNASVLFGLSGTGKTTLSAADDRALIGDDEIVWTPSGLSNLEGGCYAKLIDLTEGREPQIYRACNREGAIMENVVFDHEKNCVDFTDGSKTENTRGSYSIEALDNIFNQNKESTVPKTIIFLTADAFGAMPVVAKLDSYQSQYHFISGYTAKVAGTELGITEPRAAFSACFGAPFMPRPAAVYAKMLADFTKKSGATVWLLNTGWTSGPYGVGKRFPLSITRRILTAIQNGEMNDQPMHPHPIFGFSVPESCPGVEAKYLAAPEGEAVEALAEKFATNIETYAKHMDVLVLEKGGPSKWQQAAARTDSENLPSADAPL